VPSSRTSLKLPLMLWTSRLNALDGAFDLGEVGRAQILSWSYQPNLPDNAPHRHTYFEVCTLGAWGAGEFRPEGASNTIGSGDTFFARPGVIHQIVNTSEPGMELFWVSFSLDARSEAARDFASNPIAVAPDETVLSIWQTLRLVCQSNSANGVLRSLASALLGAIIAAGASQSKAEAPLA